MTFGLLSQLITTCSLLYHVGSLACLIQTLNMIITRGEIPIDAAAANNQVLVYLMLLCTCWHDPWLEIVTFGLVF